MSSTTYSDKKRKSIPKGEKNALIYIIAAVATVIIWIILKVATKHVLTTYDLAVYDNTTRMIVGLEILEIYLDYSWYIVAVILLTGIIKLIIFKKKSKSVIIYCTQCGSHIFYGEDKCLNCGYQTEHEDSAGYKKLKGVKIKALIAAVILVVIFTGFKVKSNYEEKIRIGENFREYLEEREQQKELKKASKPKPKSEAEQREEDLELVIDKFYTKSTYMICEGHITNKGKKNYKFVEIKILYLDNNNEVIDTDWTYGIGSEGLAPGESTKFTMREPVDYKITSCEVEFMD